MDHQATKSLGEKAEPRTRFIIKVLTLELNLKTASFMPLWKTKILFCYGHTQKNPTRDYYLRIWWTLRYFMDCIFWAYRWGGISPHRCPSEFGKLGLVAIGDNIQQAGFFTGKPCKYSTMPPKEVAYVKIGHKLLPFVGFALFLGLGLWPYRCFLPTQMSLGGAN